MPLVKGKSKAAIGKNIGIERKAGKPAAQAAAIAYSEARKSGLRDKGYSVSDSEGNPGEGSAKSPHGSRQLDLQGNTQGWKHYDYGTPGEHRFNIKRTTGAAGGYSGGGGHENG